MIQKKGKDIACMHCGLVFFNTDAVKVCSNCFACTGCEIYTCPYCGKEVVLKPVKKAGSI